MALGNVMMDGRVQMPESQVEDRGVSWTDGKSSRFLSDLNREFQYYLWITWLDVCLNLYFI